MFRVERPAEVVQERFLGLLLLDVGQVSPFLGLGLLDESDHIGGEQATLGIESVPVALIIAAGCDQVVLDGGLEGVFFKIQCHFFSAVAFSRAVL